MERGPEGEAKNQGSEVAAVVVEEDSKSAVVEEREGENEGAYQAPDSSH